MNDKSVIMKNYDLIDIKSRSISLETLNSIIIQNSPDTVYFGDKSLNSLVNLAGADIFQSIKNKTCLCSYASTYTNGSIFKFNDRFYVLTTANVGVSTYFDILVLNKFMLRCNIAGIDRMANLMIGLIDVSSSATQFYNSSVLNAQAIINMLSYFDLGPTFTANPFLDPTQVVPGENLFIVFHNLYDSPTFARSFMIDNYYRGNLLDAVSLEAFIFDHRPNPLEGGVLVFSSTGKIVGIMTQQVNYTANVDRNIAIGISSNIVRSFILNNINQYYNVASANITTQIKNRPRLLGFLGMSYYPITPRNDDYSAVFNKLGYMGGLRLFGTDSNYLYWYNKTNNIIVKFTTTNIDVNYSPINNPIIRGGLTAVDTDLYNRSNSSNKTVLLSITFYSILAQTEITLPLGRYEGQYSLSRFIYEYGPDSKGLWRDIQLTYIYFSAGNWQGPTTQTIVSKMTAYQGVGANEINYGIDFVLPTSILLNNIYNTMTDSIELTTYIPLTNGQEFPPTHPYIYYKPADGTPNTGKDLSNGTWSLIVYIYAEVPGTVYFRRLDSSGNPITPVANDTLLYIPSIGYQRFVFPLSISGSANRFYVYYRNGPTDQRYFKMETVIASSTNIILQQTTQTPGVLAPNENYAVYQYQNMNSTINPTNYPISSSIPS